jgi:hypothetical protein
MTKILVPLLGFLTTLSTTLAFAEPAQEKINLSLASNIVTCTGTNSENCGSLMGGPLQKTILLQASSPTTASGSVTVVEQVNKSIQVEWKIVATTNSTYGPKSTSLTVYQTLTIDGVKGLQRQIGTITGADKLAGITTFQGQVIKETADNVYYDSLNIFPN